MLTAPDCVLADDVPCSLVVEMLPTSPPPFPLPSSFSCPLWPPAGLPWAGLGCWPSIKAMMALLVLLAQQSPILFVLIS